MVNPFPRRLAIDQVLLRQASLPPNILFVGNGPNEILPQDLTQVSVWMTGPAGSPYTEGRWQVCLRMSGDYPDVPPEVTFKTRLWHPNVDENTGAVSPVALRQNWTAQSSLRDILVTISDLLIAPLLDAVANCTAASLWVTHSADFAARARLMTSLHARIPPEMDQAIESARKRAQDCASRASDIRKRRPSSIGRQKPFPKNLSMRKRLAMRHMPLSVSSSSSSSSSAAAAAASRKLCVKDKNKKKRVTEAPASALLDQACHDDDDDNDDDGITEKDECKENDPPQSPEPVVLSPFAPRKRVPGKRPLSELPLPIDPDDGMTSSEKNIEAGNIDIKTDRNSSQQTQSTQAEQSGSCRNTTTSSLSSSSRPSSSLSSSSPWRYNNPLSIQPELKGRFSILSTMTTEEKQTAYA